MNLRCAVLALALGSLPALAQSVGAGVCDGDLAVIRVSTIKPGAMSGYMEAVAAHLKWYRDNGIKDNQIITAPVIVPGADGSMKKSDKEVLSFHINPPGPDRTPNRGDAAWKAYVEKYRATSTMDREWMACMPKHPR
jgi:hypothetical protein